MKSKKTLISLLSLLTLFSCRSANTDQSANESNASSTEEKKITFYMTKDKYYLGVDDEVPLEFDFDNCTMEDIYFTSLDDEIASVDEDGIIKGIKSGYTEIIVEVVGLDDEITVPVCVYSDNDAAGIWTYTCDDYSAQIEFTKVPRKDPFYSAGTSWNAYITKETEGVVDTYVIEYWYSYLTDGSISTIGYHWYELESEVNSDDRIRMYDENTASVSLYFDCDDFNFSKGTMTVYVGTQMGFYDTSEHAVDWEALIGTWYEPEGWGFSHGVGVEFKRQ